MSRLPAALACLALAASLTACGSDDGGDDPTVAEPNSSAPSSPTQQPAEQECEERPATEEPGAEATTDLATKPEPQIEDGPPPCDLVITDIVVGEGEKAVAGSQAAVKYVGVPYDGGQEFDSSWSRAADETLPVPVGSGAVIPGFDQAITGMREGGRRQVVIPSELGYGPAGRGPIPPSATLVFVIDLVEVTPA